MDPNRKIVASPSASPTGDKASPVRHVLKAFNAIEVGKPSKRNIAFDVTPTKNSEIENIGKTTDDPHEAAGSTDPQIPVRPRILPDIVTTALQPDSTNNDSLCGLLDNLQKLTFATPTRRDDPNHLSVDHTLDSHASSDDEAFLECNSFVDESMLLQRTLQHDSREDIHTFLNETELLNPPTPGGTPDFMESHNILNTIGEGWSSSTMSASISVADSAMKITENKASENGNGNGVDTGGSDNIKRLSLNRGEANSEDSLENVLHLKTQNDTTGFESVSNSRLETANGNEDADHLTTGESRNLSLTGIPDPIKSPLKVYDSDDGSPNPPVPLAHRQFIETEEPIKPADDFNRKSTLEHNAQEEERLPLPGSDPTIESTVDSLHFHAALASNVHVGHIDNLNQTVDMVEEVPQLRAVYPDDVTPIEIAPYAQINYTEDEAMDVDDDNFGNQQSLDPVAGALNETAVISVINNETAVLQSMNDTFDGGNVTFDGAGLMANVTVDLESENFAAYGECFNANKTISDGNETVDIGNTTVNIASTTESVENTTINIAPHGDDLEFPSHYDFGHEQDIISPLHRNAIANSTVVIDNPCIARRSTDSIQNATYLFKQGASSAIFDSPHDDDVHPTAVVSKRLPFLDRTSTMESSDKTHCVEDSTLNETHSSNEDTTVTLNATVCHDTRTMDATDDSSMFKAPSDPGMSQFDQGDLFKIPNMPKSSQSALGTLSAASSTLSLNEQFGASSGAATCDMWGMKDDEFQGNGIVLQSSDFDFLLSKGSNADPLPNSRDSLLLRFDPLLGRSILVTQPTAAATAPTIKEEPSDESFTSATSTSMQDNNSPQDNRQQRYCLSTTLPLEDNTSEEAAGEDRDFESVFNRAGLAASSSRESNAANATMSVGLIQDIKTDCDVKPFAHKMEQNNDHSGLAAMDLERKIKAELLKSEDAEKKLKEAEQREESLLRRITDKDKMIVKMTGLIEQYEKAIAELLADKEAAVASCEAKNAELRADRDSNFQHLSSLENTFSDLHAKYERSKQLTAQLKESEAALMAEKEKTQELLRQQEQRYEIMKNHAIQQLDIANNKLEVLTRNNTMESAKLKAHLKKEEISRQAALEQLVQKNKENEELMKICDELINGQSS